MGKEQKGDGEMQQGDSASADNAQFMHGGQAPTRQFTQQHHRRVNNVSYQKLLAAQQEQQQQQKSCGL